MPYYRIEDADTGEVLADNVYLPYDYYDGDSPTSIFSKAVSKIITLGLKLVFLILPLVVLLCLYPYLLISSIGDGTFHIVDSVLANPFSYIWLALLIVTIVKIVSKIRQLVKIRRCKNKETTTLDEDDCEDARKESELRFFSTILQLLRYIYVGAISIILLFTLIPLLPTPDVIYANVLSMIGAYLFLLSMVFDSLQTALASTDQTAKASLVLKRILVSLLKYLLLATVVASIVMMISTSDTVLLSSVMLSLNIPYVLTYLKNKKEQ